MHNKRKIEDENRMFNDFATNYQNYCSELSYYLLLLRKLLKPTNHFRFVNV